MGGGQVSQFNSAPAPGVNLISAPAPGGNLIAALRLRLHNTGARVQVLVFKFQHSSPVGFRTQYSEKVQEKVRTGTFQYSVTSKNRIRNFDLRIRGIRKKYLRIRNTEVEKKKFPAELLLLLISKTTGTQPDVTLFDKISIENLCWYRRNHTALVPVHTEFFAYLCRNLYGTVPSSFNTIPILIFQRCTPVWYISISYCAYHTEEEVDMGPLVHEETDRVAVNRHFQDEVGRRAGFHRRPYHSVMVRMYQSKQEGKYERKNTSTVSTSTVYTSI